MRTLDKDVSRLDANMGMNMTRNPGTTYFPQTKGRGGKRGKQK